MHVSWNKCTYLLPYSSVCLLLFFRGLPLNGPLSALVTKYSLLRGPERKEQPHSIQEAHWISVLLPIHSLPGTWNFFIELDRSCPSLGIFNLLCTLLLCTLFYGYLCTYFTISLSGLKVESILIHPRTPKRQQQKVLTKVWSIAGRPKGLDLHKAGFENTIWGTGPE